jgi:CubicO group peptidase (beta-lactamase class C family)
MENRKNEDGFYLLFFFMLTLSMCVFLGTGSISKCMADQSPTETSDYTIYEKRIKKAIKEKMIYECVIHIGQGSEILFERAYGMHIKKGGLRHKKAPPSSDAIYDVASVTKPVSTATSILILHDMGKLGLQDKVSEFLPELKGTDKENITVFQLLTHTSGFKYKRIKPSSHAEFLGNVKNIQSQRDATGKMSYSRINYILLQIIVERVTGEALAVFSGEHVFSPLKMKDTTYDPPQSQISRVVPNKFKDGAFVWGKAMAGHHTKLVDGAAGLFSSVSDLARYCRMIINQGELDGTRILKRETSTRMVSEKIGWWYFDNDGPSVFHPGGTGTMIYINPSSKKYLIFLSNGFHSYFKKKKAFQDFINGFAELADGQELGSIKKLKLISR